MKEQVVNKVQFAVAFMLKNLSGQALAAQFVHSSKPDEFNALKAFRLSGLLSLAIKKSSAGALSINDAFVASVKKTLQPDFFRFRRALRSDPPRGAFGGIEDRWIGSGANFLKCMFLLGEFGFPGLRPPERRPKVRERCLAFR